MFAQVQFDWIINLGTIIQLVLLMGGIVALYTRIKDDFNAFKLEVKEDINEVKTTNAGVATKVDLMFDWFVNRTERRD